MAFQLKDFNSITASMINWMKAVTTKISDFNVGSVVRTMVEAVAAEIDELYQQFFLGVKEAIPVATYNSFSFDRLKAVSATSLIRVTIEPSEVALIIQAGTTFSGIGLPSTYSVLADTTVPAGASYVDVAVQADATGVIGNIASGQSFAMNPEVSGFVSATNLAAFISGQDEETDDERKDRFAAYINSISRATTSALKYGLSTATLTDAAGNITERVAASAIIEPYLSDPNKPIALVECYIHNGVGNTSAALVAQAQKVIDGYYDASGNAVPGYKAAGIPTTVYPASEFAQDVDGVLTPDDGYDAVALAVSANEAVAAYLLALEIGKPALRAEIIHLVQAIDGVYNFSLSTPAADVPVSAKQKIMPGSLDITP